ncbi:single-stranded DNA-binding protein WHY1, chloroplastic-like isoform X2 [Durio zibethinus]|uniref:Single-stranded DNA-binding protein WHY1, chloroplastic-like isoform X2 n=1 Tax=Durio zibethinus TaxID=66656 RepID=A0A6P5XC51_DURZI|nr:single-stranded DNA-binding protein WHY1, chloroplastic-like isoform X2 [Durio zibethinus]
MLKFQFLSCPPLYAQTLNPNPNSNTKLCPFFCHSFSSLKCTQTHAINFNPLSLTLKPSKFSLKCRQSEYFDQKQRFSNSSSTSSPPPSGLPPRFYVGHSIYKGKAALAVEPRAPEFVPLDSGAFKVSRAGFVLLQFAPAAGVRQYDWSRKQLFSLSVTEIGTLISLGARESCEFFHDPFKGKSEEGKVRKVLKVEPLADVSGHLFNLGVQNKLLNMDQNIYIPITRAEFTVLNSAFNFILPYLLGWHAFANSSKPDETTRLNNANPRSGGDYEWSR